MKPEKLSSLPESLPPVGRSRLWLPASLYLLHPCSRREAVRRWRRVALKSGGLFASLQAAGVPIRRSSSGTGERGIPGFHPGYA
ncbi:hypothetical protein MDS_2372 [Ectopseudomonas mendocina NK-01]|nr:hypothetical protein MDS_2372 [Pseudomonas mendocina NK-01]